MIVARTSRRDWQWMNSGNSSCLEEMISRLVWYNEQDFRLVGPSDISLQTPQLNKVLKFSTAWSPWVLVRTEKMNNYQLLMSVSHSNWSQAVNNTCWECQLPPSCLMAKRRSVKPLELKLPRLALDTRLDNKYSHARERTS